MRSSGSATDAELARMLAEGAGKILVDIRYQQLLRGYLLGDVGDAMAQTWIAAVLAEHRPGDAVLSEEAKDTGRRLSADRVWIIDPLDGTREFSAGRNDWAVHIALTEGGQPTDCAVSLPAIDQVFSTDSVPKVDGELSGRMVASRGWTSFEAGHVSHRLGLKVMPIGSAGAKAMAVVRGDADAYVHAGGQYEWDNCAPVGVAQAAGLHCSRIDGSELEYNRPNPFMPDFVICRRELRDPILSALDEIL
ncbi:3'(2'),5'-bisphosphate nucleotidase CysQ [Gordonia rubripertincta]|uniref:3'(2'),5-bisphosphonucleoside 3'(2')-phosphohydrolase n=1 Tax=Gordonia rubripertincta TaxID=36822 RepID=A0ABT4MZG8_GORRU|nr:3'(2'),5'-bisphosphate nucleotidase CysQ [Gordonia rubripertincta]MCZ4552407.1 3'(2'),5'-bisphosphate nucleotidase CysQ [Gordonia rubripertincta]